MIPGALGSFDVMMMFELSLMGVSKPTIIIWLLLFRIFYYIVPLIVAGVLFLHDLARQANHSIHVHFWNLDAACRCGS